MLSAKVKTIAPRAKLMRQIDSFSDRRYIYIHAPAGYGKTVAANLWTSGKHAARAFVALDEYDNKLEGFCRRFCLAISACQPENEAVREYTSHPAFSAAPDEYTVRAIDVLEPGEEAYLVIDDLHIIHCEAVLRALSAFIRRLPQDFVVVILSRAAPPAEFSDFLVKNDMAVIGGESLRFSADEIEYLFKNSGVPIGKKQAEAVLQATEGWAIAVNAVLLSGRQLSDQTLIKGHLDSFIHTQVWEKWSQDTRDFMVKTAFEDELTPGLCTALSGREDSGRLLEALVKSNSFIDSDGTGVYHFHLIFRTFLRDMARRQGEDFVNGQLRKAAEWYYEKHDMYKAIDCFARCGDDDGVAKCFLLSSTRDGSWFVIDKMMAAVRKAMNPNIIDKYPFMLGLQSWAAYVEGRGKDMEAGLDQYYARLGEITGSYPREKANALFLQCIDYRISMRRIAEGVKALGPLPRMSGTAGTITQHMPLFHRSSRDFSEYSEGDVAREIEQLKQVVGNLFGKEQDVFEQCLVAGIFYEQGRLVEAHRYALSANAMLREDTAPEAKFCAMMILTHVLLALWQGSAAESVLQMVEETIEKDRSYYLLYNLNAYKSKVKLDNGDTAEAEHWLESHGVSSYDSVDFLHLCGSFTSARAYITLGKYDQAIMLLTKIMGLATLYNRPLDTIEAKVLLAIAYWKKKRGYQKTAMTYLEQAVLLAHKYHYVQVFANEGADLTNMLHRLQGRVVRQDYTGDIPGSFTKMLYLHALSHSKYVKGLTGGQTQSTVKFTDKQKTVMRLLCEGKSYREIAEAMNLKFSTVRSHIELIYKKLDVPNETEAIVKIREMGILGE